MTPRDYEIRPMTRSELDLAVDWAAAEGWNPGLRDADCFHAADPEGFLVGLLDGEPIGSVSAVRYGDGFGFLGFYIVTPEHRGQGYGIQLWNAALEHLEGRTVGLDGVVAQQDNYRRSGFVLADNNLRHEGVARASDDAPGIVPLSNVPFDEVVAYDRPFFADDRRDFLECWVAEPHTALGVLRGGELAGYGVIRACRKGFKVGPLFADVADDATLADDLFRALCSRVPEGSAVFLDTPSANAAAVALARNHGMTVSFETARMYLGPAPDMPSERLFGITTFELG
jgi:ribosomal protein S18 acetylase RimI-like enzyme